MRRGNYVQDSKGNRGRIIETFLDEETLEPCAVVNWGYATEDMYQSELSLTFQVGDRVRGIDGQGLILRIQLIKTDYVAWVDWDNGDRTHIRIKRLEPV
jgi:ABC-type uncharacterized transport system auxiliary subunit